MSFKSGVKDRGSDRWWERRWWLWWGDMHRMRWTRRTVNRMRLTEQRREQTVQGMLAPQCIRGFTMKHYIRKSTFYLLAYLLTASKRYTGCRKDTQLSLN